MRHSPMRMYDFAERCLILTAPITEIAPQIVLLFGFALPTEAL